MDLKEQYDKLLRYCYMKTKDRDLAEDLVQETFIKFWESKTYKDTGKEMAYLYTIARNLCMDHYRKSEFLSLEEVSDQGKESGLTEEIIDLEKALDRLPEDMKEMVVLRYREELSAKEIGELFQISRFSAYRKIREGLNRLRKYLEEEGLYE